MKILNWKFSAAKSSGKYFKMQEKNDSTINSQKNKDDSPPKLPKAEAPISLSPISGKIKRKTCDCWREESCE
jgi:hypothetical protein